MVFFAGRANQAHALLSAADLSNWHPQIVSVGSDAVSALVQAPSGFKDRIFLTFPTLPTDRKAAGKEIRNRLASRSQVASSHLAAQYTTLAAAELLKEGLKRAGRELTRENLIQSLEGLYQHETGFTQLISYGPNRRTGARGAYIVSLDLDQKSLIPIGGWRERR